MTILNGTFQLPMFSNIQKVNGFELDVWRKTTVFQILNFERNGKRYEKPETKTSNTKNLKRTLN